VATVTSGTQLQNHGQTFDLNLSPSDEKWIIDNFPSLKICKSEFGITEVTGKLYFLMDYDEKSKKYIVYPKGDIPFGTRIKDNYEIKIVFERNLNSQLPQVSETGSKISTFASLKKMPLVDLHMNPGGCACLCVLDREKELFPNGFNIKTFFNDLLIPFFYQQTFFKKYNKWPWGQYAHGIFGVIEKYGEKEDHSKIETEDIFNRIKSSKEWYLIHPILKKKKNIQDYKKCFCGSRKKFRDCHPAIVTGLLKIKNDLIKYSIPHKNI